MNKREKKRRRRAMEVTDCRCEVRRFELDEVVRVVASSDLPWMSTGFTTALRGHYTVYRCAVCGREYTDAPAMAFAA